MNNNEPLFLLDIDGVLNLMDGWIPAGKHYWDTKGRMHYPKTAPAHLTDVRVGGYRLLLNPDHGTMVSKIEEKFDCVWATMWQQNAWKISEHTGFGYDWDYIDFSAHKPVYADGFAPRTGNGVGNHKNAGIIAILGDRPGIWVDDDMTPGQRAWAQRRTEAGIPTLFIQPDPEFGMTWEHFEQIMAFADALANRLEDDMISA